MSPTPHTEHPAVSSRGRRTLLKGAAWTVPAVVAATAAPAAAASTPSCPTCLTPGVLGAVSSQAVILGNHGALLFSGALGLDSSSCDLTLFRPAYTSVVTSATLTMTTAAGVSTDIVGTGLGSGTGTFGQLGAVPGSFLFSNLLFPNGVYLANSNPVRPTRLTITMNVILIGLPGLITLTCPVSLSWNLTVFGVGTVIFGAGTIQYTGVASPA